MASLNNRVFENATIRFRNFAGRAGQYNTEGDRNFLLFLDPEKAQEMREEGWNVKQMKPREEGDVPQDYVQVTVEFDKGRPPRIVLITNNARTEITGNDTIVLQQLDYMEIANIDLVLNPYAWEVNGNKGVKAYLKTAYITLYQDELDLKYAEDPTDQTPSTSSTVNEDEEVLV